MKILRSTSKEDEIVFYDLLAALYTSSLFATSHNFVSDTQIETLTDPDIQRPCG